MKKISIVVPVYNVEKYLKKCLDSIVKQTYENYEVIIVCDKCHDASEKIVDEYVKKHSKFKKIYAEKTGLATAKNIGVKASSGEYLLFLDGDDYLEKDLLQVIVDNTQDNPDLIRFQAQDIINNKTIKHEEKSFDTMDGKKAFQEILRYHYIENSWLYAYNLTYWKKNKFQFMNGCIAEDYGLTPLVIAKAKKVKGISFIGYNYVQRDNSLMNNDNYDNKLKKMDDMLKQADYLHQELKDIPDTDHIKRFINNSLLYYSTTLKKSDYKKIIKKKKKKGIYDYIPVDNVRHRFKKFIISRSPYFYYHHLARFL